MKSIRAKDHEDARDVLVVQRIVVTWWKAARGGEAAAARNALPLALPLSEAAFGDAIFGETSRSGFLHDAHAFTQTHAKEGTTPTTYEHRLVAARAAQVPPNQCHGLTFAWRGGEWVVRLDASTQPTRPASARVAIPRGRFLRFITNGRYAGFYATSYARHIYNVGLFSVPTATCFVSQEPIAVVNQEADLF